MEVLITGSGAREHALALKATQSPLVSKVFVAPGNPGIAEIAECLAIGPTDVQGLVSFRQRNPRIGLTIAGPELTLEAGVGDAFLEQGWAFWGSDQAGAQIEVSKTFAKELMDKYGIPTAASRSFNPNQRRQALSYFEKADLPIVIKEDGLAAGKGATIIQDLNEGRSLIKHLTDQDSRFLLEEYLTGDEISTTGICVGREFVPLLLTQDHKALFEGGPNTGGMGVITPLPFIAQQTEQDLYQTITQATLDAMAQEGLNFNGFLYSNIMMTPKGPRVLEHNARFGDPEAQTMLPLMENDLIETLMLGLEGNINQAQISWAKKYGVSLTLASGGYPGKYEIGRTIEGVDDANKLPGIMVMHAGTARHDGQLVTSGGRVLSVVSTAETLLGALQQAYYAATKINFEGMYYRKDIGQRGLNQA